jgi:hypothetical protein
MYTQQTYPDDRTSYVLRPIDGKRAKHTLHTMKRNVVKIVIRGRQARRSISGRWKRRGRGNERKDRLVAEGSV